MPTLTCLWARPRVERHVDGALGPRATRAIESHLASCGACLAVAEGARRTRALVREAALRAEEPDWSGFWPGVQAKIRREQPQQPVKDSWWLPIWRPFWGHPRLSLGGALAAGLLVALSLWPSPAPEHAPLWSGSVIVQDASTPDPNKGVMVYSIPDPSVTVIWLFDPGGPDDS
jgi:hypothetical protein